MDESEEKPSESEEKVESVDVSRMNSKQFNEQKQRLENLFNSKD